MNKELYVSSTPHETKVAMMEDDQLAEVFFERENEYTLAGSIYKGRVTRVLPGMQSAFVDIGLDGDAFLYVSDFLEDIEEFDHIVTTVEDKVQKMEDQGGQVFAASTGTAPALEPADVESAPGPFAEDPEASRLASESFDSAPPLASPTRSPAPTTAPPSFQDRPRFDRHRGGRDFDRRGGGGRRGGGRHGHGRPGRDRGGRGGERRYGRELPSSKYASPRSHQDQGSDSVPAGNYVPVILPGESFAKYKDRGPSPLGSAPPILEPHASAETPVAHAASTTSAPIHEPAPEPRPDFPLSRPHLLEPLPGESISKWKRHEPLLDERGERPLTSGESAALERVEEAERELPEGHDVEVSPAMEAVLEEQAAAELSDEEASALAEHIAEAQSDQAERAAESRAFGAPTEVPGAAIREVQETAAEEFETEEHDSDGTEEDGSAESDPEDDAGSAEAEADAAHDAAERLVAQSESEEAAAPESGEGEEMGAQQAASAVPENLPLESQPWKAQVRNDFRSRLHHPSRRGGRDRDRGRRDDRGRRPHHGHGHRPQPRRTQLISDLLKQGQEIIVQIAKEPLGKKGARITSHVALPGRFLVYMPTLDHTGVSRKIASPEDRSRLRHLVNDAKGSAGGGFIVRTAAAAATSDEVRADVEFLTRTWADIKSRAENRKAPSLLHRDLNLVERILRDYLSPDFSAIWVDSEEEYTKVVDFVSRFQPSLAGRVKLYTKDTPVFEEFGIQQEIDKGLRPKVWLKSGGYIVINHTEALVAIDVNTGKFVGKGSTRLEDTIVRTNLEAVKEIVRQMRLRDLGGIIIIDFIDMEERRNREKVMAALEDALRADRAPSKVLRFNEFGLVAITRKRTKQALERTLCQPCPYCTGSGMVKSIPTLCYEIQAEARKMAPEMDSGSLTLRVHPEIAKALKTRESSLVEELERWTKKSVIIQADPTLHWEQYDIY
jgi:Rne/Rng family ribonuclease